MYAKWSLCQCYVNNGRQRFSFRISKFSEFKNLLSLSLPYAWKGISHRAVVNGLGDFRCAKFRNSKTVLTIVQLFRLHGSPVAASVVRLARTLIPCARVRGALWYVAACLLFYFDD